MAARLGSKVARKLGLAQTSPALSSWPNLIQFQPDLVCISHGGTTCALPWMLICLEDGFPYVSIANGNSASWWPGDEVAPEIRRAYFGARKAYFVSQANADLFQTQITADLPNLEVIRNPFSVPWDSNPPWPDSTEGFKLACVAQFDPVNKGQDLLFSVLAESDWRKRPIEVSLFGNGNCAEGLRRLIERHNLGKSVRIAGYVDDVGEIWKDHHAIILPSRAEGLPISLVEAMLCGRFGIVTNVAGAEEVIEDEVNGFVAATPSVNDLRHAMERAWSRRHDWRDIGQVAAESIRAKVPPDPAQIMAERLLNLAATEE